MNQQSPLPYERYASEMTHSEWMQLMIHYYRGEMHRATIWRQRLDVTTNWAVVATAAMMTFILGNAVIPHEAIILPVGLVFIMLHVEARRYLYYDLWRSRLRMLERGLIAPALWKETAQHEIEHETEWRRILAEDMREPRFHMPYREAFGRRLQRNYVWLLLLNYGAWLLKIAIHPRIATTMQEMIAQARIGSLAGPVVFALATGAMFLFLAMGPILTYRRRARGVVLPYKPDKEHERWGLV